MWKKIIFVILLIISGVLGFFVAKAQITFMGTLDNINRDTDGRLKEVDLSGIEVNSDQEIVNILVVGNDYRKDRNYSAAGLTDTMIIATMDLKHNTLKTTSLMRDSYVEIPGYGHAKLNAANSYGGIRLLYKTIAQNYNIKLDGYVEVGFHAFVEAVDAVGGVKVTVTESEANYLNSTNYIRKKKYRNVKVGEQTLNGQQALGYCRIRKAGTTVNGLRDDYGRTWRQRTVINAVFDKLKTLPMSEWIKLANKVLKNVTTDLTNEEILSYMKSVLMMGTTKIHQLQLPISGYYTNSGSDLVMTDGITSEFNPVENAKALNKFIFEYDGKGNFVYGTFENKEN